MLIAATSDGRDLTSGVSEEFDSCSYLLLIETSEMTVEAIENSSKNGEVLANQIVEHDCEAVITGKFSIETFSILADACVTRYNGYGRTVREALAQMDRNSLEYIRGADENDSCHGDHSGGVCSCCEID